MAYTVLGLLVFCAEMLCGTSGGGVSEVVLIGGGHVVLVTVEYIQRTQHTHAHTHTPHTHIERELELLIRDMLLSFVPVILELGFTLDRPLTGG